LGFRQQYQNFNNNTLDIYLGESVDSGDRIHQQTGITSSGTEPAAWIDITVEPWLYLQSTTQYTFIFDDAMIYPQDSNADTYGSGRRYFDGSWQSDDLAFKLTIDETLPVTLSAFNAVRHNGVVQLRWRTETEVSNIGFNIYRSESKDGKFVKINKELIRGAGNSVFPIDYKYVDKTAKAGKVYYYYIEDIDVAGVKTKSPIVKSVVKKHLAAMWGKLKIR